MALKSEKYKGWRVRFKYNEDGKVEARSISFSSVQLWTGKTKAEAFNRFKKSIKAYEKRSPRRTI